MTIGLIVGALVLAAMVWLANGIRRIGAVSAGEPISGRSKTALLLIDLQTVFWERGPYSEADKQAAAEVILAEVAAAQAQGYPVIAVRQEWSIPSTKAVARLSMKGQAIEGSDGTELAPLFSDHPDHVIVKRVQDAFETGELDGLLKSLDVGALRLVGLDLNYCVFKSALAARNRGYDITVVTDGCLSAAATQKVEAQLVLKGAKLV